MSDEKFSNNRSMYLFINLILSFFYYYFFHAISIFYLHLKLFIILNINFNFILATYWTPAAQYWPVIFSSVLIAAEKLKVAANRGASRFMQLITVKYFSYLSLSLSLFSLLFFSIFLSSPPLPPSSLCTSSPSLFSPFVSSFHPLPLSLFSPPFPFHLFPFSFFSFPPLLPLSFFSLPFSLSSYLFLSLLSFFSSYYPFFIPLSFFPPFPASFLCFLPYSCFFSFFLISLSLSLPLFINNFYRQLHILKIFMDLVY